MGSEQDTGCGLKCYHPRGQPLTRGLRLVRPPPRWSGAFLFLAPTVDLAQLEIPFFLHFEANYGTLYMYGDKNAWCARAAPAPAE